MTHSRTASRKFGFGRAARAAVGTRAAVATRAGVAALAALAGAATGCDREDAGAPAPRGEGALELEARGEGEVVARVFGDPVRARCVRDQARAHGVDREAALQSCIEFALLSRAAAEQSYADAPEVLAGYRRELARALIREEFATDLAEPADVPREDLEAIWPRAEPRLFDHAERRFTFHVRAPVPEDAERGGDADERARALAEEIHHELRDYTNLEPERFVELAVEIADGRPIQRGEPGRFARDETGIDEAFVEAAFAIPEEGMIAEPARTNEGWDLVLLTDVEPETRKSFEEALPELREEVFEDFRREAFEAWSQELEGRAEIERYPDPIGALGGAERPAEGRPAEGRL